MSSTKSYSQVARRQTSPLMYFLMLVSLIFIGILIFAYIVTKRTNPIYVDERGNPVNSQSAQQGSGSHHP